MIRTTITFKGGGSTSAPGTIEHLREGAPPNFIRLPTQPWERKTEFVSLDLIARLEEEDVRDAATPSI